MGTGFSDDVLALLSERLAELASDPPKSLIVAGDPLPNTINWVRPELVAEVKFLTWTDNTCYASRLRRIARGQAGS